MAVEVLIDHIEVFEFCGTKRSGIHAAATTVATATADPSVVMKLSYMLIVINVADVVRVIQSVFWLLLDHPTAARRKQGISV